MKNVFFLVFSFSIIFATNAQINFSFTIDINENVHEISPYIYGVAYKSYPDAKAKSLNGSRMTSFNWETNVSNSGSYQDDITSSFQNDYYLAGITGVAEQNWSEPGKTLRAFQENCNANNQFSIISIPMAGYVALDTFCADVEIAPSSCWEEVKNDKDSPSVFPPDLTDNVVYNEECIQFLVDSFGMDGVDAYFLDNEPGLWYQDYPYIVGLDTFPALDSLENNLSYRELVDKSIALATTIKQINPDAEVFGPALSGYVSFDNLAFADSFEYFPDTLFVEYYLSKMKKVEDETGERLLDVFDMHWYSGDQTVIWVNATWDEVIEARLDAPRTLWDTSFQEINTGTVEPLQILNRLQSAIDLHYPGTKMAVSEYFYGAPYHVSGGLAEADALGVFGREDVYFASLWPTWGNFEDELDGFIRTAFDLYLNYDGNGAEFGNQSVLANSDDAKNSSVYASVDTVTKDLHIIAINKSRTETATANINMGDFDGTEEVDVYSFDENSEAIQHTNIAFSNMSNFEMSPLSAYHFIVKDKATSIVEKIKWNDLFSIFPNPATSQFFRIENKSGQKIEKLELYNLNQKMVFSKNNPVSNEAIQINQLPAGLYFVKIITNNQVITKSIVIFNE